MGAIGRAEDDEVLKAIGGKTLVAAWELMPNPPNLERGVSCAPWKRDEGCGICTLGRGGIGAGGAGGKGGRKSSHDILMFISRLLLPDVKVLPLVDASMLGFSSSKSRIARSANGSAAYKSCTILVRSACGPRLADEAEEN
jgi:hypothetical protein